MTKADQVAKAEARAWAEAKAEAEMNTRMDEIVRAWEGYDDNIEEPGDATEKTALREYAIEACANQRRDAREQELVRLEIAMADGDHDEAKAARTEVARHDAWLERHAMNDANINANRDAQTGRVIDILAQWAREDQTKANDAAFEVYKAEADAAAQEREVENYTMRSEHEHRVAKALEAARHEATCTAATAARKFDEAVRDGYADDTKAREAELAMAKALPWWEQTIAEATADVAYTKGQCRFEDALAETIGHGLEHDGIDRDELVQVLRDAITGLQETDECLLDDQAEALLNDTYEAGQRAGFVGAFSSVQDQVDQAYKRGQDDAYKAGYSAGFIDGDSGSTHTYDGKDEYEDKVWAQGCGYNNG